MGEKNTRVAYMFVWLCNSQMKSLTNVNQIKTNQRIVHFSTGSNMNKSLKLESGSWRLITASLTIAIS